MIALLSCPRYLRRSLRRLIAMAALTLIVPARAGAQRDAASRESVDTRKQLTKNIRRFQSRWRRLWQESIIARNGGWINMELVRNDETYGVNTPEVLRLYALTCYVEYGPFQSVYRVRPTGRASFGRPATSLPGGSQEFNLRVATRVETKGNNLAVCPRWIPAEIGITVDEGERIDLALVLRSRAVAYAMRDSLLTKLAEASARFPGDEWIAGQRVRFLIDNQAYDRALQVTAECGAASAWCAALAGLVHAKAGAVADAENAFKKSLQLQSPSTATVCADTSPRVLFPESVRLDLRSRTCGEWNQIAERTWWLSQPLWQNPDNVRFVEHYARRTLLTLRTVTDEDERYNWRGSAAGEALKEVIMRYGWPTHTWWGGYDVDNFLAEYAELLRNQAEYPYTVKEYAPDRLPLIPDYRAIAQPFDALDTDWQWEKPRSVDQENWFPPEHMASPVRLSRLPTGQSVLLRRDTSVLYGHVIDDPVQSLDPMEPSLLRAYVLASSAPDDIRTIVDTALPFGMSLRLAVQLRAEPTVLSIEVPNRNASEPAHRRRFGVRPPSSLAQMRSDEVALSDPAFVLMPTFGAPPILDPDSAIARLAGSTQLPRNVPLALYWESYGFAVGDTVDVQLRILREDGNPLRSVGALFGLVDAQRDSVSIRWREPDPGRNARALAAIKPTVARAVSVDIRNLAPGNYAFIVEMTRPDGVSARGERRVEIVR